MSWITSITPESAPPTLKPVYERIRARSSSQRVSRIWQAWGAHPEGLESAFNAYRSLMDEPAPLTTAQAEMIALVVSATNGCGYCVAHHGPKLAVALANEALARAVARDYRAADVPARDRVLFDYAVALSCEPAERTEEDVERLREYGFDDPAILQATEVAALFNLLNRLINGLGVTLEDGVEEWAFGAQK